ncbi:hypothetical protein BT69DRAFT_413740 [Atractiella rhizophila]|nr:hypothetical protein BT69DRAFT_413740 [Atractiella rhizophila]
MHSVRCGSFVCLTVSPITVLSNSLNRPYVHLFHFDDKSYGCVHGRMQEFPNLTRNGLRNPLPRFQSISTECHGATQHKPRSCKKQDPRKQMKPLRVD